MLFLTLPAGLRLLALDLRRDKNGAIQESYRCEHEGHTGTLHHDDGSLWNFYPPNALPSGALQLQLDLPDAVFAAALGEHAEERVGLRDAAPHWPKPTLAALEQRGLCGEGTIAFDGPTFLELLATSDMERPVLLPNAPVALQELAGLERARELMSDFATTLRCGRVDVSANAFAETLQRAERAESAVAAIRDLQGTDRPGAGPPPRSWGGAGRLIAEWPDGELAQLGTDIRDGCALALGSGIRRCSFAPDEPLGIWFYPLARDARRGCEVGGVEPGSQAEALGVEEGMIVTKLEGPDVLGLVDQPYDEVLALIDERRDAQATLSMVFETAAPVTHLYAVEMPAMAALSAIAASEAAETWWQPSHADASSAVRGALESRDPPAGAEGGSEGAVLWGEEETKAFLGDPGSLTSAHVDIAPQLELAHGLHGIKFLGVADHGATARMLSEHAADVPGNAPAPVAEEDEQEGVEEEDEGWWEEEDDGYDDERVATSVPTDRPLAPHESSLLTDPAMSLAVLAPGDLLVFSSAALHFASNGAAELSAALYHGFVTQASLPRLQAAVARRASQPPRGARGHQQDDEGEMDSVSEEDQALSAAEVLAQIARGQRNEA